MPILVDIGNEANRSFVSNRIALRFTISKSEESRRLLNAPLVLVRASNKHFRDTVTVYVECLERIKARRLNELSAPKRLDHQWLIGPDPREPISNSEAVFYIRIVLIAKLRNHKPPGPLRAGRVDCAVGAVPCPLLLEEIADRWRRRSEHGTAERLKAPAQLRASGAGAMH